MKPVKLSIALLLLALAGVIGWQATKPSDEPVYKGRTLTSWLTDLGDAFFIPDNRAERLSTFVRSPLRPAGLPPGWREPSQEAAEAVRQIGTNAIPTLLRLLRAKDSSFKVKAVALLQRQHLVKIGFTPSEYWPYAAAWAFSELGESASNAVPRLLEIANAHISPSSQRFAITSLGFVGPPAKAAVPALLLWATNTDPEVRYWAATSLRHIDPEAAAKAGLTNVLWQAIP